MKACHAAVPLVFLLVPGCLDIEEQITVRPDGSVAVEIAAKGDPEDLGDGYPVPLHGPWRAADAVTAGWIAGARPAVAAGEKRKDVRLRVGAEFASTRDLPEGFAPPAEPYPTAYLQRATSLRVEHKGAVTMYVFERTFRARTHRSWEAWGRFDEEKPDGVEAKLESWEELSASEWRAVTDLVRRGFEGMAEALAREACLGIYVEQDASLPVADLERIVARSRTAVGALITSERLTGAYRILRTAHLTEVPPASDPLAELEQEVQRTLRNALIAGLAEQSVASRERNYIAARLEWCLTAMNHTDDLQDESFEVTVNMPGIVVGGNFDRRVRPGSAQWQWKGERLRDRDVVLRVVSIVE